MWRISKLNINKRFALFYMLMQSENNSVLISFKHTVDH